MSERQYFVLGEDNCKFESMTKEQIIEAIAEATGSTPTRIDDAFITKIKEQNHNNGIKIWVGTQAEYNGLQLYGDDILYIITDEEEQLQQVQNEVEKLQSKIIVLNGLLEAQYVNGNEYSQHLASIPLPEGINGDNIAILSIMVHTKESQAGRNFWSFGSNLLSITDGAAPVAARINVNAGLLNVSTSLVVGSKNSANDEVTFHSYGDNEKYRIKVVIMKYE